MDLNETNITPEQSDSLVRVFERHVRDTDHQIFPTWGLWVGYSAT
jgi:hypothetical protein